MSLVMSAQEREAFLAGVHIGVVSVEEEGRGPLLAPVWYAYEPGGDVLFVTGRRSRKGRLLHRASRMSMCVQTETPPYRYVTVEGAFSLERPDFERHIRAIAHRYLGPEQGEPYIASTRAERDLDAEVLVRLTPERWLSADYGK